MSDRPSGPHSSQPVRWGDTSRQVACYFRHLCNKSTCPDHVHLLSARIEVAIYSLSVVVAIANAIENVFAIMLLLPCLVGILTFGPLKNWVTDALLAVQCRITRCDAPIDSVHEHAEFADFNARARTVRGIAFFTFVLTIVNCVQAVLIVQWILPVLISIMFVADLIHRAAMCEETSTLRKQVAERPASQRPPHLVSGQRPLPLPRRVSTQRRSRSLARF